MVPPVSSADLFTGDIVAERWNTTTPRELGVHGSVADDMAKSPEPCPVSPEPCPRSPEPCPRSPSPCTPDDGCLKAPKRHPDKHHKK